MKKTILATAIAATTFGSLGAQADLAVTSMVFGNTYTAAGTITDSGAFGWFHSTQDFFYQPWSATQQTGVITNSNGVNFVGPTSVSAGGSWDFAADIALMTNDQVAVGVLWNWNASNDIAVLAVFDCTSGTTCVGQTTGQGGVTFGGMQNGPFTGSVPSFSGTGTLSAVPVPAAVWLMGSGLIGLIGVARRKKTQ